MAGNGNGAAILGRPLFVQSSGNITMLIEAAVVVGKS